MLFQTVDFPSRRSFFSLVNSSSVIIPCSLNFASFVSSSATEDVLGGEKRIESHSGYSQYDAFQIGLHIRYLKYLKNILRQFNLPIAT